MLTDILLRLTPGREIGIADVIEQTEKNASGRRQRIVEAAMTLFGENGYEAVSMRDIATAADVTPSLIVHHFKTKQGLRGAVTQDVLATLQKFDHALEQDFDPKQQEPFSSLVGNPDLTADPVALGSLIKYVRSTITDPGPDGQALFEFWYSQFERLFNRLDAAGTIRPDVDRLWMPYIWLSANLGILLLEPLISKRMGRSMNESELGERFQKSIAQLFERGMMATTSDLNSETD